MDRGHQEAMASGLFQCVAVRFSVLQCVAVCCSHLKCVAVFCSWQCVGDTPGSFGLRCGFLHYEFCKNSLMQHTAIHANTLQHTTSHGTHRIVLSRTQSQWLFKIRDKTRSDKSWDCLLWYVTWLIRTCDVTHSYVWHDSFVHVIRLIYMRDMMHSYVWHNSFLCVSWFFDMRVMTRSYMWHHPFMYVPWLIHLCATTHSYVCHDSFICAP